MAICQEIQHRHLDISWACRSRVDIDFELLSEMRKAGCSRIYYGIESGSQKILDKVYKKISLDQVRATIKYTKALGIKVLGFFLIGAPGETRQTVKQTVQFAKELDLDYVQFSKCLAKPLTPLWEQMVEENGEDYWRNWILGKETDRQLPRPWTKLTNEEIDQLARRAYVSYYARPSFLLKATLGVKSVGEFKRKLFSFLDMVCKQENISKEDKSFVAYHE